MEHKINQVREFLEARKETAREAIAWGQSREELQNLEKAFVRASRRLAFFNHVVIRPPEGTELVILNSLPVVKNNHQERKSFSPAMQRDFFKAVLKDRANRESLLQMGIKPHHCAEIAATGWVPLFPNGKPRYDIVVGHMRELEMGGTNAYDNLYLLPIHLEDVKMHLIDIQKPVAGELDPSSKTHLALVPLSPEGQLPKVPFIPGGFRNPVTKHDRTARIEEFLAIEKGQWKHSDAFIIRDLGISLS